MAIFGYAHTPEPGPSLDNQIEELKAAGCQTLFQATGPGSSSGRDQLTRLLAEIGSGDTLVVTRLAQLAGSTRDLLTILDALVARGASFRSLGEPWTDTTGPHNLALQIVLKGLADFERDVIRGRTGAGRSRAKARGIRMGRPPKLTAEQWRAAEAELASGATTQADLARRLKVSEATISRHVSRFDPVPVATQWPLDADTQRATRAFMRRIESRYPLQEAFLFGSRARGTHNADSDADVAVILKGEKGDRSAIGGELSDVAYDVMLETGVLIGAIPLWADEFERPETFTNPELIRNIRREGLRL